MDGTRDRRQWSVALRSSLYIINNRYRLARPVFRLDTSSCSIGAPQSSNRGASVAQSGRPNLSIGAPQPTNRGAPTTQSRRPNHLIGAPQPINRGAPVEKQVATDSEPDCYYKRFAFKGKKGDVVDFKIFFPKLPPTTRKVAIYGVPNWSLRGREVILNRQPSGLVFHGVANYYDQTPEFHHPKQIVEAKNYDKDNFFTWSEYTDAHLIKPVEEGTMAMWLNFEYNRGNYSGENWSLTANDQLITCAVMSSFR